MTIEHVDAVVIGAGLGGLSAASYLAKAGKKVLVLEHHAVPGGYAHEFRRGHYRFDVSLHALDGIQPGGRAYLVLNELGVLDQVRFTRLDPIYTSHWPDATVAAHADVEAYEAELVRLFPHQAQQIRALIEALIYLFNELAMVDDQAMRRQAARKHRADHVALTKAAMSQSWAEFMGGYITDPHLQSIFSALWSYYGLPPSKISALSFIMPWANYHVLGGYYPEGGSMAMSHALEQTIKAHGGQILYRQTVNRIKLRNGLAVGVETQSGLEVEAGIVVSNANAPDTLLSFVGREHLNASEASRFSVPRPSLSSLAVYLGLNQKPSGDHSLEHEVLDFKTYDLDADFNAAVTGRFDQTMAGITTYSAVDPTCAPAGGEVMVIMSLASWDYANQWGTNGNLTNYRRNQRYLALKEEAGAKLIARAEEYWPELRRHIKYCEVSTPLTNMRYTCNPRGSLYGFEQTTENARRGLIRLNTQTSIPNLFLAGVWGFSGGQSNALFTGREAARSALAYETASGKASQQPSAAIPARQPSAPSKQRLPAVTLTTIGSERRVALSSRSAPVVLLCSSPRSVALSLQLNQLIRKRYSSAAQLGVVQVIDMHMLPPAMHAAATKALQQAYLTAQTRIAQQPIEDYLILLPDWNGDVVQSLGIAHGAETVAAVLFDAQGNLVGSAQGEQVAAQMLALLADLLEPSATPA
jgi:phytoene dehydrogenase-like protein